MLLLKLLVPQTCHPINDTIKMVIYLPHEPGIGGGPGRLDGPEGGDGRDSTSFTFTDCDPVNGGLLSFRTLEPSEFPVELLSRYSLHTSLIFCPRSKLVTPTNPPSEPDVGTRIVSCATI